MVKNQSRLIMRCHLSSPCCSRFPLCLVHSFTMLDSLRPCGSSEPAFSFGEGKLKLCYLLRDYMLRISWTVPVGGALRLGVLFSVHQVTDHSSRCLIQNKLVQIICSLFFFPLNCIVIVGYDWLNFVKSLEDIKLFMVNKCTVDENACYERGFWQDVCESSDITCLLICHRDSPVTYRSPWNVLCCVYS